MADGESQRALTPQTSPTEEGLDGGLGGLSSPDAQRRLAQYGPNEIPAPTRSLLLAIGSHFWGPIPWMIEAAVILTAAVGRWADFGVILALLVINGAVGIWEEHEAGNAIAALKEQLALSARVRRDGEWQTLQARVLVPGDLVHVELGQIIPADGRVTLGACEADQSSLTDESLPVAREPGDELFSGSVLLRGEASMLVSETGPRTMFGRSAQLAGAEPTPSHFHRAMRAIGRCPMKFALTLLSDAAILMIAFDRVEASVLPERWNMHEVLTVATALGVIGVVESFSLLRIGQHVLGLSHDTLRTLMYLKLSAAGHLTLFVARTRGPFRSVRPATILFVAVVGTQIIATLIAISGVLMQPVPWPYAVLAWAWAGAWLLPLDAAKLATYRRLDGRHIAAKTQEARS